MIDIRQDAKDLTTAQRADAFMALAQLGAAQHNWPLGDAVERAIDEARATS